MLTGTRSSKVGEPAVAKPTIAGPAPTQRFSFTGSISAWYDNDDRAVWILLGLFVAIWTSFQVIAYSAIGIHDDLAEVFVWSQHPSAGYLKHPPLAGLMAAVWFQIFPVADWSFDLMAMVNSAVALFAIDRIARRYVSGDKRLLVLLLLLLTPFYQFHGQRFSTNQALLSTWPIATWCFLRAFETRRVGWSVLAGATAALAMLGKYYSIYLIAAFVIAALSHRQCWNYLRSPAPWISISTGLVVLAPHLYWLATTGIGPFQYAMTVHGSESSSDELMSILEYLAGGIGYVLLPLGVFAVATRPDRSLLGEMLWPADADRRMLVVLLGALLLLPVITAPLIGVKITSLWTMSAWFLLPIVLLSPARVTLTRTAAVRVATGVAILTTAVLAAAPAVAWSNFAKGTENGRAYYRVVGEELTRAWRTAMGGRPLTIVAWGDPSLAQATSFYSPDHPDSAPWFGLLPYPSVTDARLRREGWASACFAEEQLCAAAAERHSADHPGVMRIEETLTVSFFGMSAASKRFIFILTPALQD
jgi:4-amino-4-deoxy-L-arabinose transferase-like glycosyltransferase